MLPPEIETGRLRLRAFTVDDVDGLQLIFGDAEAMRYITAGETITREESAARLGRTIEGWRQRGFGFLAVTSKDSAEFVGYCGFMLLDKTPEVEIAYAFNASQWGRGFATEAARACLRWGFEELKLERVVAVVNPQNTASQRVLEKLGMTYVKRVHHYDADLMYYEISSAGYSPCDEHYSLTRRGRP
jgi:RimJ/RimL family protein N-acetyltransferase